jgi:hypothetical protein
MHSPCKLCDRNPTRKGFMCAIIGMNNTPAPPCIYGLFEEKATRLKCKSIKLRPFDLIETRCYQLEIRLKTGINRFLVKCEPPQHSKGKESKIYNTSYQKGTGIWLNVEILKNSIQSERLYSRPSAQWPFGRFQPPRFSVDKGAPKFNSK